MALCGGLPLEDALHFSERNNAVNEWMNERMNFMIHTKMCGECCSTQQVANDASYFEPSRWSDRLIQFREVCGSIRGQNHILLCAEELNWHVSFSVYYKLDLLVATGWAVRGSNPRRGKRISLPQTVQTVSGAHPTSCSMDTGFFLGVTVTILTELPSSNLIVFLKWSKLNKAGRFYRISEVSIGKSSKTCASNICWFYGTFLSYILQLLYRVI